MIEIENTYLRGLSLLKESEDHIEFKEAKPLPDFSDTDNYQVSLKLRTEIRNVPFLFISGKSLPTIDRHLSILVKRGLVEHRGSFKTGGYYVNK